MSNPEENRIQEILSAYLDDELTPAEKAAVDGKLQNNPALQTQLEALRLLRKTLVMEDIPSPPAGLAGKIKNRLPAGTATAPRLRKRRRFNYIPLAAAAMVTVGVITGGIYLDQQGRLKPLFQNVAVKDQGAAAQDRIAKEPAEDGAVRDRLKSLGYVGTPTGAEGTVVPAPPQPSTFAQEEGKGIPGTAPPSQDGVMGAGGPAPRQEAPPATGHPVEPAPHETMVSPQREAEAAVEKSKETFGTAIENKTTAVSAPAAPPPQSAPFSAVGSRTWTPPGAGMLNWSVAPPQDPAKVLGGLAQQFGGKGWLVPGPPRAVRITVPREQWKAFLAALRSQGVAGTTNLPEAPAEVEQVTLVVAAPSLPGNPGR